MFIISFKLSICFQFQDSKDIHLNSKYSMMNSLAFRHHAPTSMQKCSKCSQYEHSLEGF
jgi:hypothetical protein